MIAVGEPGPAFAYGLHLWTVEGVGHLIRDLMGASDEQIAATRLQQAIGAGAQCLGTTESACLDGVRRCQGAVRQQLFDPWFALGIGIVISEIHQYKNKIVFKLTSYTIAALIIILFISNNNDEYLRQPINSNLITHL